MVIEGLVVESLVRAVSSGLNAGYFWGYCSPLRRRRIGARVLALASSALALEGVYFAFFLLAGNTLPQPQRWLIVRLPLALASLAITALIIYQKWGIVYLTRSDFCAML